MHPLSHSSCSQCSTLACHFPHPDSQPARASDSKRQVQCSKALWIMTAVALTCVHSAASAPRLYALPMQFESNVGQTGEPVQFLARGPGYTLFLTPTQTVLSLRPGREPQSAADNPVCPR